MEMISLAKAPLGAVCTVGRIEGRGPMRSRLTDLGLLEGTRVTPLFNSLCSDPRAYNIRGAVIALRNADAELIKVTPR